MELRCIIVDDELQARQNIKLNLAQYLPELKILAEAANFQEAVDAINNYQPDLVFLDVDLGDSTGFDVLQHFKTPSFQVIFVTAFAHHAIQAFRVSAVDYLLKPVDAAALKTAVDKVISNIEHKGSLQNIMNLLANQQQQDKGLKRLILHTSENIHVIEIKNIIRCESDVNYTIFYLQQKEKIMVSRTLKEFDEMLQPYDFFRVHQSHLINLSHIIKFDKRDGGSLLMSDQSMVPVATRKKEALLKVLSGMSV